MLIGRWENSRFGIEIEYKNMADDAQKVTDGRVAWIENRLQLAMPHLKSDKLKKGLSGKDAVAILEEFLDGEAPMLLINGDSGTPMVELPDRLPKAKWVYILKKNMRAAVPSENIGASVTVGDMSSDPLQHLELTIREIIIPQISSKVNQGWGEVGE